MSGVSHQQPSFRGMRRNNAAAVKVEERRLQKLLDFIDNRMQDQRSKLRRQIEDTQQSAEEMEEKKHKATLQVLKTYFEVTSGRIRAPSSMNYSMNHIHEERMMGVLSEPSLATVPEIDPDILAKPRSMYDKLTRTLDTSRLPLIAPNKNIITVQQTKSLPASLPNSNRSSDESSLPRVVITPRVTPSSTPRNTSSPSDSSEETVTLNDSKKQTRIDILKCHDKDSMGKSPDPDGGIKNGIVVFSDSRSISPTGMKSLHRSNMHSENDHIYNNYDEVNGQTYQKGLIKPTHKMNIYLEDAEPPTPRLGDIVASKGGLSRHISLKRPLKYNTSTSSAVSMSELQLTRKQQAASKLKQALKGSFRVQR